MLRLSYLATFLSIVFFGMSCKDKTQDAGYPGKESSNPGGNTFFQIVTGNHPEGNRKKWDHYYDRKEYVHGKEPIPFLKEVLKKVKVGPALVLAMGEGQNAVYLARKGFDVEGVDFSEVALRKAWRLAKEFNVTIKTTNSNLRFYKIKKDHYQLIVNVTYFRSGLIPHIKNGLKKGGYVVFQNYLEEHLQKPNGLSVPKRFTVAQDELKRHFKDFDIVEYREINNEKEAIAQLFARKR